MSTLVIQFIIKQWDKRQRTQQHSDERAKIPDRYPIIFPPASYIVNDHCVIDQHGDDLLGNRIRFSQPDDDTIRFDRFHVNITNRILDYIAPSDADSVSNTLGSLDNTWIQCKYDWRYGVDEGGFYYWLYEAVTLNAMYVDTITENLFMDSEPEIIVHC